MSDSIVRTPWKDYMGEVPMHLEYFDGSMFEAVEQIAKKYPGNIAFTFMGKSTTYRQMIRTARRPSICSTPSTSSAALRT